MFKNYLKIAFRNILKNKVFLIINTTGLAIGIACAILIILSKDNELSYDRFHKYLDRIYILTSYTHNPDKSIKWAGGTGEAHGPSMKDFFSEIKRCVRAKSIESKLKKPVSGIIF